MRLDPVGTARNQELVFGDRWPEIGQNSPSASAN